MKPPGAEKFIVYTIPCDEQLSPLRFGMVEDPAEWKAAALKPIPPIMLQDMCRGMASSAIPQGIVFLLQGKPESLLSFAASHAFKSMSLIHLRKLAKLHLTGQRNIDTRPEKKLLEMLVKHFLPETTAEDVACIVATRVVSKEPEVTVLTELVNDDLVDGLFEVDDAHEIKKHAKKVGVALKKKSTSAKAPAATSAQGSAAASSSDGASRSAVKSAPPSGGLTSAEAQQWKPRVVGCQLDKDMTLHMRWTIRYPKDSPPLQLHKSMDEHRVQLLPSHVFLPPVGTGGTYIDHWRALSARFECVGRSTQGSRRLCAGKGAQRRKAYIIEIFRTYFIWIRQSVLDIC